MPSVNKLRINGVEYDLPGGGGGGTSNYNDLLNKPQINGNTLSGNKTSSQLGLASASDIPTKTSDLDNDSNFITGLTILTYGSSTWNDFITAFNANKVVFVRCGAGTTPGASTKPILAHLVKVEYYNENPRYAEFRFDDYVDQKTYANQDDHIRIYKLFTDNGWTLTTVPVAPRIVAGDGINYNWEENQRERTLTLSLDRASITTVSFEVVQTLPSTGEANVIYLVPKSTAQTNNTYDEYIYTNNDWEKIGDTEIDLSNYYTKTVTNVLLSKKYDVSDTAETNLEAGDYFPFNDVSDVNVPKKKISWGYIKGHLKTYFDTLYTKVTSSAINGNIKINDTETTVYTLPSDVVQDSSYVHTDSNYTATEKNKLSGIASGAEVNQNAFSNVKVGSTTIQADSKTDTLELVAGANVTLTPDATNDKVTISATDTTYSDVTQSVHGLMSTTDKTKLDGISSGAEVNQNAFSNVKVGNSTIQADSKTDTLELVAGANVTLTPDTTNDKVTISATDTTYSLATTSTDGLMSSADKIKVETISTKYDSYDLTEATLANDDKVPFYDTSEDERRNSTWSNIKAKLKTYFDDIYPSKSSLARVATSGYYDDLHNTPSSLPASDVYAWAKAATKPTYTKSEVGLGNVPNVTTNNQTPTFTQASSRANIASGETIATIFGKMMKWYTDLKNVAFSGSSSDINFDSNTDIYEYFLNFWHQNQGVYDTSLSIGYDGIDMQGDDLFELRSHGVRWNNKYKSWNDIISDGGGGLTVTVLWTNPSPTASYTTGTITLSQSLANFRYYGVICRAGKNSNTNVPITISPVSDNAYTYMCTDVNRRRQFSVNSNTTLSVGHCTKWATYGSSTTANDDNYLLPYQIIGIV